MKSLLQLLALTVVADPHVPTNYCGRVDVAPQVGVKNFLTSPGYPEKTTDAGRCQWV